MPVADLKLRQPITGQVYDVSAGVFTAANGTKSATALSDNDRGFYDFNTLPNSYTKTDAVVGQPITVDRATQATDGHWYWGLVGSTWAINDNALDLSDAAARFGFAADAPPSVVVAAVPAEVPAAANGTTATTTTVTIPPTPVPGKGCLAALLPIIFGH